MIHAAPISALLDYYRRLADDPNEDIAAYGFRPQDVSVCIVLKSDGRFRDIQDLRQPLARSVKPVKMKLPYFKTRTVGEWPNFLWDHSEYVLAIDLEGNVERAQRRHRLFVELHQTVRDEVGSSPELEALTTFFEHDVDLAANRLRSEEELVGRNIVFRFDGVQQYFHEVSVLRDAWMNHISRELDSKRGISLIDGKSDDIADTHPLIRGVGGTKQGKAAIISFNLPAFRSYGKSSNYNAPIGLQDAFCYATSLNTLLERRDHKTMLGDTTTVFWSAQPTAAEKLVAFFMSSDIVAGQSAEDEGFTTAAGAFLDAVRRGVPHGGLKNTDTPFYILGMSPNAARISVRFWLPGTVGEFADRLAQHVRNLELAEWHGDETDAWLDDAIAAKPNEKRLQTLRQIIDDRLRRQTEPLSIRAILDETVPAKQGRPDRDRVNPRLAGELARSLLDGTHLPRSLWSAILDRIQVEGLSDPDKRHDWRRSRHRRVAILKACVNQYLKRHPALETRSVNTYLDKTHPSPAYHCGRLMAVLAFSQEQALGQVNASVVRRYLSGVIASPGTLGRLQVHAETGHIPKLDGTLPSMVRDELKQINCAIGSDYPRTFNQLEQSFFVLGFYQQMARLDTMRSSRRHRWRTNLGDWVRSKGEVHVANALAAHGVTYVYEPKAVLDQGQDRIPDFLVPDTSVRNNIYIEYLGMNTPSYNQRWEAKLEEYHRCGISEDGGERGRLVVVDDRETPRDQPAITSYLMETGVLTPELTTTASEESNHA